MKKRTRERQSARITRAKKHRLTDYELSVLTENMSEDEINVIMKRLKKVGLL
jgi:hypothetical protein